MGDTTLQSVTLQKQTSQQQSPLKKKQEQEAQKVVREEKIKANQDQIKALHQEKLEKSMNQFKDTKVTSCSQVLVKNGNAVCVAFKTGGSRKSPEPMRSSESTSFAQESFKMRTNLHVGMVKKPLEPYHPNAHRNRMPSPTVIMPYKNASQIVIGDRSSDYKKHFKSSTQAQYGAPKNFATSNPGIEEQKLPDWTHFLKKRDFISALTLLECDKKYSHRHDLKTYLGIAYCAFHNGDYKKAMDIYDELTKRSDYDRNIHAYKACCQYALCNFKEAKVEASKAEDGPLKNRLLFQLAQKVGDENEIMNYHSALSNSIEDQLCMAALHYLRSHFEEATEIYKKLLIENKDFHAINIYVALCYYKMDYYDVSLDILAVYLGLYPDSVVGVNLKACNHYQLYNGKAAEAELKVLQNNSTSGNINQDNDLIRHNLVVFRAGENALQVLPPLIDVIPEARLNLVIYYLKNDETNEAYQLIKDMECVVPKEYIIKAVVHAVIGQNTDQKEHLRIAQNFYQMVGASPSECDTIPGRQCMASCFFILKQFDDVLVYLKSIRPYFLNDDDFNWNYGIASAAAGDYKEGEEGLLQIQNEKYRNDYCYLSWLCRCYIMNKKPHLAWEIYINMETSNESLSLLNLIANDCYKMGQFYHSVKAFDVLERLDPDPEFWEGKRGAAIGVFQMVVAGKESKERLIEIIQMLKNTNNPQVEYFVQVMKKWGKDNGFKF